MVLNPWVAYPIVILVIGFLFLIWPGRPIRRFFVPHVSRGFFWSCRILMPLIAIGLVMYFGLWLSGWGWKGTFGISMDPTIPRGSYLKVSPLDRPVRVNDIIVFRKGLGGLGLWIKRVSAITPEGIEIEGDNENWSRDHRDGLKPVAPSRVIGYVKDWSDIRHPFWESVQLPIRKMMFADSPENWEVVGGHYTLHRGKMVFTIAHDGGPGQMISKNLDEKTIAQSEDGDLLAVFDPSNGIFDLWVPTGYTYTFCRSANGYLVGWEDGVSFLITRVPLPGKWVYVIWRGGEGSVLREEGSRTIVTGGRQYLAETIKVLQSGNDWLLVPEGWISGALRPGDNIQVSNRLRSVLAVARSKDPGSGHTHLRIQFSPAQEGSCISFDILRPCVAVAPLGERRHFL